MINDISPRTQQLKKYRNALIIAILLLIIGMFAFVTGRITYGKVVAKSSSPMGTKLTFKRSQADVILQDLYTDENKDVLVARISMDTNASQVLPYKGNDYTVYLAADSLNGKTFSPIIFGKMSTDGDMFLVLPYPKDEVYNVFIMNNLYLNLPNLRDTDISNIKDLGISELDEEDQKMRQSLGKVLTNYKYDPDQKGNTYEMDNRYMDIISFRLTVNPAFKDDPAYAPKVIDAKLIKEDSTFDFETFFNKVYKDQVIMDLTEKFRAVKIKKSEIDKTVSHYQERLDINPQDADAAKKLADLKNQQSLVRTKQQGITDKLNQYNSLQYTSDLFSNLRTWARIIDTGGLKK